MSFLTEIPWTVASSGGKEEIKSQIAKIVPKNTRNKNMKMF